MLVFTRRPGERFRIRFKDGTIYWVRLLNISGETIEIEVGKGDQSTVDPLTCNRYETMSFEAFEELCSVAHEDDSLDMGISLVDVNQVRFTFEGEAEIFREELLW